MPAYDVNRTVANAERPQSSTAAESGEERTDGAGTAARTSFFLYLMPSERHDTAPVTAIGGRGAALASSLCACVVMNSLRMFASVNCGCP